jgi:nucleotide-binding universal stress UspA family protein
VVGVDGSESSLTALDWAAKYARAFGGRVLVLTAWHYPVDYEQVSPTDFDPDANARSELEEAIGTMRDDYEGLSIEGRIVRGPAGHALVDASGGADLLVVGSRGHGGLREKLLGSVGVHCVHRAKCPVVVIRHSTQA